uniref:Large ribosomal subunit protein mL62 n=1 Tax=Parastrongyloides trichosuri TaxID=131310 RepID=A0A0N4ZVN2_PARTI
MRMIKFIRYCSIKNIDSKKLILSFPKVKKETLRSSGPGGQNVNQVSTKVQLTCNINDIVGIDKELRNYIKSKYKLTKKGDLIVESDKFKNQKENNEHCYEKLTNIIEKFYKEYNFINRVPSKEEKELLEKREERKAKYRLDEKRRKSLKKQSRSKYFD